MKAQERFAAEIMDWVGESQSKFINAELIISLARVSVSSTQIRLRMYEHGNEHLSMNICQYCFFLSIGIEWDKGMHILTIKPLKEKYIYKSQIKFILRKKL